MQEGMTEDLHGFRLTSIILAAYNFSQPLTVPKIELVRLLGKNEEGGILTLLQHRMIEHEVQH